MAPKLFYCIYCGNEEPHVYKTYAKGNVIKLLECSNCGELIDKYMEYDTIIVAINLVLQNKMAYRHVLLNTGFQIFWKLGIMFLFCESYCYWCYHKGMEQKSTFIDFYELELNFYLVLLRSVTSSGIFHGMVLLLAFLKFNVFKDPPNPPSQFSYFTLCKGLHLCGFAEVFELFALIWSYSTAGPRIFFVIGLLISSNSKSYEVITGCSRWESYVSVLTAYGVQQCLMTFVIDVYWPT